MTEALKELQKETGAIIFILFIIFSAFFTILGSITGNSIGLFLGVVAFIISLFFLLTGILPHKKQEAQ